MRGEKCAYSLGRERWVIGGISYEKGERRIPSKRGGKSIWWKEIISLSCYRLWAWNHRWDLEPQADSIPFSLFTFLFTFLKSFHPIFPHITKNWRQILLHAIMARGVISVDAKRTRQSLRRRGRRRCRSHISKEMVLFLSQKKNHAN